MSFARKVFAGGIGAAVVIVAVILLLPSRSDVSTTPARQQPTYRRPAPDRLLSATRWGESVPADQLVIHIAVGSSRPDAERIASQLGARVVGALTSMPVYQLEGDWRTEEDLARALDAARRVPGVTLAMPNYMELSARDGGISSCSPLDDPVYRGDAGAGYGLIHLADAWAALRGSGVSLHDVNVGVIDKPLWAGSGEFGGSVRIRNVESAGGGASSATHANHVAAMVGADPANGGPVGVASPLDSHLILTTADTSQADVDGGDYIRTALMEAQIAAGATIINASWGWSTGSQPERALHFRRFAEAVGKQHPEVLFVVAAGNEREVLDGTNDLLAGLPLSNVITVGGVDTRGAIWSGTGRHGSATAVAGGEVTIAAPSVGNVVGSMGATPETSAGTSFAAPQVAGAAALMRAANPALTASEIKTLLRQTATPIEANAAPVLRVDRALLAAINAGRAEKDREQLDSPARYDAALAQLRALGSIAVTARRVDRLHWAVTAALPGVGPAGSNVSIEAQGQGKFAAGEPQHLAAAGSVQWTYVLSDADSGAVVVATRTDSGACGRVTLNFEEIRIEARPDPVTAVDSPSDFAVNFAAVMAQPPARARWDWDFGDGEQMSGPVNPAHLYRKSGVYRVTVVGYDVAGRAPVNFGRGERLLSVSGIVEVVADPPNPEVGQPVTFRASMENAPSNVAWRWMFGGTDWQSGSGTVKHTFDRPGAVSVTVQLLDHDAGDRRVGSGWLDLRVGAATPAPAPTEMPSMEVLRRTMQAAVTRLAWVSDDRDELRCASDMQVACLYRHWASPRGSLELVPVTLYLNQFDDAAAANAAWSRYVDADPGVTRIDRAPYRGYEAARFVTRTDRPFSPLQRTLFFVRTGQYIIRVDSLVECRSGLPSECPSASAPRPVPTREMDALLDAMVAGRLVPRSATR